VVPIRLVPLRQRREDIPLLVQDFLHHHSLAVAKRIAGVVLHAMNRLMQYTWPGNVRELHNVLERAIVLTTGRIIERVDVPEPLPSIEENGEHPSLNLPLQQWLREQEKWYLVRQLEACEGKVALTAKTCGVDIKTLYRKMHFHGLDKKAFRES
jgi:two-component system, NtrC family, response regulator AtoC